MLPSEIFGGMIFFPKIEHLCRWFSVFGERKMLFNEKRDKKQKAKQKTGIA